MAEFIRTSRSLETKVPPVLFPPGWLEKTSWDPELARRELLYLTRELNRVQTENSTVRKQRDELEHDKAKLYHRLEAMKVARDQEYARCRSVECDHQNTKNTLQALEKFRLHLENKVQEAQLALDKSNREAQSLRSRVRKLETKSRVTKRSGNGADAVSAMKRLAHNHAVGKRLAAATHPDKVPAELNDSASELFRFVQEIREQSKTL